MVARYGGSNEFFAVLMTKCGDQRDSNQIVTASVSSQAELDAVLDRNVKLLSVLCSLTYGFMHENRYKTYDEKIITYFLPKIGAK